MTYEAGQEESAAVLRITDNGHLGVECLSTTRLTQLTMTYEAGQEESAAVLRITDNGHLGVECLSTTRLALNCGD
ncbi:hypothetical protein J6590_080441 [Homalodisca vitripennis]|nr:hypothetical protein J6590_096941 [Homalodisca vitripennis]KAG8329716.1 hypothetical protein J6590_080441 [Homalodisca vitripennis]